MKTYKNFFTTGKTFKIKDLAQVGFVRPFGDCIQFTKMLYPESEFLDDAAPKMYYFPSRVVMFNILRACLGCEKKEDLWYYN
jgi:hypothetical protein